MTLVLFEDEFWRHFGPLVYTRPLFDLRCGGFTLRERAATLLAGVHGRAETVDLASQMLTGLCRSHLMAACCPGGVLGRVLGNGQPLVLVNGRALALDWLPDLYNEPVNTVYTSSGVLLGAHLSPALASAVFYYLREQQAAEALAELQRFTRVIEIDTPLLHYPWDLITQAGEQLVRDLPLLAHRLPRYNHTDAQVSVRRGQDIYVAPTARLDGPVVLDATDGPIMIDEHAHIEPFSFIQGPAYIGAKSLISSARIRGETSIGPVCRIGGEVEASTVQGFSNKHHDGFLGHSWLGEWVNVGAMTTNSDLKNTYGNIRVVIEGLGQLNSGQLKLGCFLADHVKLSIGLHLNGGTMIGTGSSIFGVHVAPKTVPAFTWGGEVFREYRIDGMIDVARRVMQRRKQVLSPEYEAMLRAVFQMTRSSRGQLDAPPAPRPVNPGDTGELLLLRAEEESVRSFEAA